jgi:hypothetical protein
MKKLMIGAVALAMFAVSCKKDDNGTPANSFKVGTTTYNTVAGSVNKSGSVVSASGLNGTTGGTIFFTFGGTSTPAAGDYTIINSDSTEGTGQVSFLASSSSSVYKSTGTGTVKATVTMNGSKISISMPDAPAKSTTGTETVTVNANVAE